MLRSVGVLTALIFALAACGGEVANDKTPNTDDREETAFAEQALDTPLDQACGALKLRCDSSPGSAACGAHDRFCATAGTDASRDDQLASLRQRVEAVRTRLTGLRGQFGTGDRDFFQRLRDGGTVGGGQLRDTIVGLLGRDQSGDGALSAARQQVQDLVESLRNGNLTLGTGNADIGGALADVQQRLLDLAGQDQGQGAALGLLDRFGALDLSAIDFGDFDLSALNLSQLDLGNIGAQGLDLSALQGALSQLGNRQALGSVQQRIRQQSAQLRQQRADLQGERGQLTERFRDTICGNLKNACDGGAASICAVHAERCR